METKITFSPKKLLLLAAMLFSTSVYSQTVITVTDCNRDGWVNQGNPNTIATFTTGEAEPLLGNGSLEYTTLTGALGNFRNESYHNTLLSSLTNFSYFTYIQSRTNNTDNIYVVLQIDRTGDGLEDDRLIFEPRWQTGSWVAGIGLPDQGPTVEKTWQTWDLLNAIWWLGPPRRTLNPEKGGIYFTLASYISQYPDARIVNQNLGGGFGGIRLNVGSPRIVPFTEYWGAAFTGYVDAFTIGINGHNTVYNFEPGTGGLLREYWLDLPRGGIATIPLGTAPSGSTMISAFDIPMNFANHYGTRVRGYLCPPTSGEYTFYLAADDMAELWLSTDVDPMNKRRIAFTNRHTQLGQYDRFRSQTSEPITLVQGQRYYIEALHKELGGVDHLSVGWMLPDGTMQRPIPGQHLIPFAAPMPMTATTVGQSQGLGAGAGRLEAYPNPFSDQVSIDFTLAEAGRVSLQVFDMKGSLVETLFEGEAEVGSAHHYAFRAGDHRTGVYICRLSYGKQVIHKRLVVVR